MDGAEPASRPISRRKRAYVFLMDWPCDDQPIWMRTRSGPLLSVPYPLEINNSPALLDRHHTPAEFDQDDRRPVRGDAAISRAPAARLRHSPACHGGRPALSLAGAARALKHIANHAERRKVWFTRPGEIAAYIKSLPTGTVPGAEGPRTKARAAPVERRRRSISSSARSSSSASRRRDSSCDRRARCCAGP